MTAILITVFLISLILIIPLEISFRFKKGGDPPGWAAIGVFFGLLRFSVYPKKAKPPGQKMEKPPGVKKDRKKSNLKRVFRLLRNGKFLDKTFRTAAALLRSLKLHLKLLYLRFGLDDPADTGMLWGLLGPISGLLYGLKYKDVTIEPEFLDSAFEIESEGSVSIVPLDIILITLGFLLSPTVIRSLWIELREAV